MRGLSLCGTATIPTPRPCAERFRVLETVSFLVPRDVMVPSLNFSCAPVGTLYTSRSLLCAVCLLRFPYGPGCGDLSACVLFNVRLGSASPKVQRWDSWALDGIIQGCTVL